MWWEPLLFGVAFLLGYAVGEVVWALRRSKPIANPYAPRPGTPPWHDHEHTRAPGWHP